MCLYRQHVHTCTTGARHTRQSLQSSCRFLLQLFTNFVREEKVVHIALISQGVLAVRANWGVHVILDLNAKWSINATKQFEHHRSAYRLLEAGLICKESTSHCSSRIVGIWVAGDGTNSSRCHGSWSSHKGIKRTRGGDSSISIALNGTLLSDVSMVIRLVWFLYVGENEDHSHLQESDSDRTPDTV